MGNEIFVTLTIVSLKHSPEEIDAFVGVKCDNSWRIGDYRAKTIIKEKDNGWVVNSGLDKNASIDNHFEELLRKLSPLSEMIKLLSEENYVEVSCAVYADEIPSLHFEKDVIHRICKLGANLDVDLYLRKVEQN